MSFESRIMILSSFFRKRRGSVAALGAVSMAVVTVAVGGSVDYARMVKARSALQSAVDSATIAAATQKTEDAQLDTFSDLITMHGEKSPSIELIEDSIGVSEEDGVVSGTASAEIGLFFGALVSGSMTQRLDVNARVGLETKEVEIALVLDVSTSMMLTDRFDPMRDAVKSFVSSVAEGENTIAAGRIALVPFSSRVNFGMERQSFFRMWNGAAAIPDRWLDPMNHYNINYTVDYWIDNTTPVVLRNAHYRWMGCPEPRLDVAIKLGETDYEPTDASPSDEPFVAMDHNPEHGATFCPPPIQPLSDSVRRLNRAIDAFTAQGSTRLDAGMVAGWYALSPNWASAWGTGHGGVPYDSPQTSKIVVFMTDGVMNTMDNPSPKALEFDWACEAKGNCDKLATKTMLSTCTAMKASGIEIYTVSYGEYADRDDIKKCASSEANFFVATKNAGDENHIDAIYLQIAESIARTNLRLIN